MKYFFPDQTFLILFFNDVIIITFVTSIIAVLPFSYTVTGFAWFCLGY